MRLHPAAALCLANETEAKNAYLEATFTRKSAVLCTVEVFLITVPVIIFTCLVNSLVLYFSLATFTRVKMTEAIFGFAKIFNLIKFLLKH